MERNLRLLAIDDEQPLRAYVADVLRELENAVIRTVAMCDDVVGVRDLPESIRNFAAQRLGKRGRRGDRPTDLRTNLVAREEELEWPSLAELEENYVARVLAHTNGNKQAAARMLGVDRKTVDRIIQRHQISFRSRKGVM